MPCTTLNTPYPAPCVACTKLCVACTKLCVAYTELCVAYTELCVAYRLVDMFFYLLFIDYIKTFKALDISFSMFFLNISKTQDISF